MLPAFLQESWNTVAIEIPADPELDGRALECVGKAALVVVARVGHAGITTGIRLGQGGAVGKLDRQPADDGMFQRLVFIPPVFRAQNVVETIHDSSGRDVLELSPSLGAKTNLVGLEGAGKSREEIQMLTHT